jgi:catalase (peroxidase I)
VTTIWLPTLTHEQKHRLDLLIIYLLIITIVAIGKCHGPCLEEEIIETFCPNKITNSYEPPYTWEQKMTSGLEVTWTTTPTSWDNEFFNNL